MQRLLALLLLAASACSSNTDIAEINALLDARNQAVSRQDVGAYSALLLSDYRDRGQTKITLVAHLIDTFDQFDATRMQTRQRQIRLLDGARAECDQNYTLSVKAAGEWRKINGREQLLLTRTDAGWRISGGL